MVPSLDSGAAPWWTHSGDRGHAEVLAGRYRILSPLGSGGGGEVFLALDQLEGGEVAIKRLRVLHEAGRARGLREIRALRLLNLPGVVRILDEGVHQGQPFLVMERVLGAPFPGEGRRTWAAIEAPLHSLLHTLARVHEAGLVHRDIKPGNVLVTAEGRAVLLDFGLARGLPVGETITQMGTVLGTPRYLAPEQLRGERADPRTDLYAVGVMVYEALAGRPPHEAEELHDLWRLRLREKPAPIERLVDGLPIELVELLDRLLAIEPGHRPATASAALEALRPASPARGRALPWLGSREAVDALLEAGRAARALDLCGPPGSGRSTCLREAAALLAEAGHPACWTRAGSAPFQSLAHLLTRAASDPADLSPAAARGHLQARLQGGEVLLVDDREGLDRWSRALLDELPGAVLAALDAPRPDRPHHALRPLDEADLRSLFHGPERLLHLPSDGAAELHRRSGGWPGAVVAELQAWLSADLCAWQDGRLRIARETLDRLRAGLRPGARPLRPPLASLDGRQRELLGWVQLAEPHATADILSRLTGRPGWQLDLELEELRELGALEVSAEGQLLPRFEIDLAEVWPGELREKAHARLALVLPPGSEGRLFLVLAAGLNAELSGEALRFAEGLRKQGRLGEAEAVLREAVRILRADGQAGEEARLLVHLLRTAVATHTLRAAERARYEVQRALDAPPWLHTLADAAVQARGGAPDEALATTAALGELPDPDGELIRQHIRMAAAQRRTQAAEAVVDDLSRLARSRGDSELLGLVPMWRGLLRFQQGSYPEAAALHEASAALRSERLGRLSARVNAALAWLEAGELERAGGLAHRVVEEAAEARAPSFELHGEWVLRSILARKGEGGEPDEELVAAAEALGDPSRIGMVCLTEAQIAWQAGLLEPCRRLTVKARSAFQATGLREGMLWTEAALAACDPAWEGDVRALVREALASRTPRLGEEVLAMLRRSRHHALVEEDLARA